MESGVMKKRFYIGGMTCVSCQNKIEKKLRNTAGVRSVSVSYSKGRADITYDTDIISANDIFKVIEGLDYTVLNEDASEQPNWRYVGGLLSIIVLLYILLQRFEVLNLLVPSRLADTQMSYGMLFVIGLITSVHCIAMCGGINLSQCIPQRKSSIEKISQFSTFKPAFLYNIGRVISYTVMGSILGLAGWLLGGGEEAGVSVIVQGILKIIAGVFMVVMGINMLALFPWLRKYNPSMPQILNRRLYPKKTGRKSPFWIGLLNGLMPCGPLQSMQIVALASGNPVTGALSMFFFSLGTIPLMLGLGSVVSALGKKFTQKVMTVGAVLVVVLGLAMLSQGGSLSGFISPDLLVTVIFSLCAAGIVSSIPFRNPSNRAVRTILAFGLVFLVLTSWGRWRNDLSGKSDGSALNGNIQIVDGKQIINSTLSSGRYPNITIQAGTPVKWIINAPKGSINGCNNRMVINDYGIQYSFRTGENIIEFTPEATGNVQYNCWMGMIRGTITVVKAG